jgi:hypothetical protein
MGTMDIYEYIFLARCIKENLYNLSPPKRFETNRKSDVVSGRKSLTYLQTSPHKNNNSNDDPKFGVTGKYRQP